MKKRLTAAVMAAMLAVTAFTGCGGNSGNVTEDTTAEDSAKSENSAAVAGDVDMNGTEITFWHAMGGVNGEAMEYLVDQFNKENEYGIKVVSEYQGSYDDALNKLKSAQLGNMGADLVQVYDIGTRFMIDSDWIIPIQDFMDKDDYKVNLEENIAAYYTVNNELYSMPFNSSTPILYYNADMFKAAGIDAAPATFNEIEKISDALKTKGGAKEVISLGIYGWFFEQFLCKQGLNYADNGNGRESAATAVEFDSNGGALQILEAWKKLYDEGIAPNVGRGGDAGLADFSSGKAAITLGSTASLKQILEDVNGKFEVGTAYFPATGDDDKGGVSIGGASLWALDNGDDKKAAATWEFIKFLVSAESQAYWNAQTGYFPVTTDAYNEEIFKNNIAEYPQFQTAIDQLHDSAPQYAGALLSVFSEARATVETEIENMLNGKQTPEEAVEKMASSINAAIEDYNLVNEE
ncbi:MAG: ABC transporter substrate-binding protein [Lachnospiraceae bacterium]|nr:ABC transporter substrate-binding protein [Lachnospiraceae bacterium]